MRTAYGERKRVSVLAKGGRTKQSMKEECDINRIMRRYIKTGTVSHVMKHGGRYDYCTGQDFMESVAIVQEGQRMFDELPAAVRKQFENSPALFLSFVQDPGNLDKMREMGLAKPKKPEAAPVPAPSSSSPPAAAAAASTPVT